MTVSRMSEQSWRRLALMISGLSLYLSLTWAGSAYAPGAADGGAERPLIVRLGDGGGAGDGADDGVEALELLLAAGADAGTRNAARLTVGSKILKLPAGVGSRNEPSSMLLRKSCMECSMETVIIFSRSMTYPYLMRVSYEGSRPRCEDVGFQVGEPLVLLQSGRIPTRFGRIVGVDAVRRLVGAARRHLQRAACAVEGGGVQRASPAS